MRNSIKTLTAITVFLGIGAEGVYSTALLETNVSGWNAERVDKGLSKVGRASLEKSADSKNGESKRDASLAQVQKAAEAFRASEEKVIENFDSKCISFDELSAAVRLIIQSTPTSNEKQVLYDLYEAMMDYGDLCNSDPEVVRSRINSESVKKFREVLKMIIEMK